MKKVKSSQVAIFVLNWVKHSSSLWVSLRSSMSQVHFASEYPIKEPVSPCNKPWKIVSFRYLNIRLTAAQFELLVLMYFLQHFGQHRQCQFFFFCWQIYQTSNWYVSWSNKYSSFLALTSFVPASTGNATDFDFTCWIFWKLPW